MADNSSPRSSSYSAYADLRDRITAAFERGREAHKKAQGAVPAPPAADFNAQHARNMPNEMKGADYKAIKPTVWENLAAGISGAATGAAEATPQLLALGADAWNLGTSPVSPGLAITNRMAQGESVMPASEATAGAFTGLEKKGERAMGVREGALTDTTAGVARFAGNIVGDPLAVTGKIRSIATDEATRIVAFYEGKLAATTDSAAKQQLMQMMRNDLARVAQQAPTHAADVAAGAVEGTARAGRPIVSHDFAQPASAVVPPPPALGYTPEELARIQAAGWGDVPREQIGAFVDQHIAPEAAGNQYSRDWIGQLQDYAESLRRPTMLSEQMPVRPAPEAPVPTGRAFTNEPPVPDLPEGGVGSYDRATGEYIPPPPKPESASAIAPIPPARAATGIPRDEGYVYHATNADRLQEIADSGELRTHPPDYGTPDQNVWPDGTVEPRAYFSRNPDSTLSFAPEDGAPVVLRTKSGEHLATERGTGDIVARKPIKSSELEYLGSDQQWHNVDELKSEAAAPTPVAPAPKPPKIKPAKPAVPAPAEVPETGNWYYDNAQHAVAEWPALKGSPDQLLAHLKKQQGAVEDAVEIGLLKRDPSVLSDAERARLAEVDAMEPDIEKALAAPREKGVKLPENIRQAIADRDKLNDKMIVPGDAFAGKKSVSRDEVLKYIDDNKIDVQEVWKGENPNIPKQMETHYQLFKNGELAAQGDAQAAERWRTLDPNADVRPIEVESQSSRFAREDSAPKYDNPDYQEPGGENYRELLLTKPTRAVKDYEAAVARAQQTRIARDQLREEILAAGGDHLSDPRYMAAVRDFNDAQTAVVAGRDQGNAFTQSHWDEPNVLAHIRMNDRTLPDGRKMLFVEEFQSDWHQKGWERGYAKQSSRDAAMALDVANNNLSDFVKRYHDEHGLLYSGNWNELERNVYNHAVQDDPAAFAKYRELKNAANKANEAYQAAQSGIPDAPFKGAGWKKLVLKRVMKYAADNGYDVVGWTSGAQQNARYGLSKVADSISWGQTGNETRSVNIILKDGSDMTLEVNEATGKVIPGRGRNAERFSNEQLKDVVGDDVAKKILGDNPEEDLSGYTARPNPGFFSQKYQDIFDADGKRVLTMGGFDTPEAALKQFKDNAALPQGTLREKDLKDLEIGGKGKKHLYDEELPSLANKIFGEHGVKTGKARIDTRDTYTQMNPDGEYVGPDYTPEQLKARVQELGRSVPGDHPGLNTWEKLNNATDRLRRLYHLWTDSDRAAEHTLADVVNGSGSGPHLSKLLGGEWRIKPYEGTEVHAIDVPQSLRGTGKGKSGKLPLFNVALPAAGAGAAAAAYQNSTQRSSDLVPAPPKP